MFESKILPMYFISDDSVHYFLPRYSPVPDNFPARIIEE